MVLFTFQTNYDALINETKLQSLRWNVEYWLKMLEKPNKLDIWWRNPRNKHPDCKKLGIAVGTAAPIYGHELTLAIAITDGYNTLYELLEILMDLHNTECEELLAHRFAIITWFWVERYWLNTETLKTSVQTTL